MDNKTWCNAVEIYVNKNDLIRSLYHLYSLPQEIPTIFLEIEIDYIFIEKGSATFGKLGVVEMWL